MSTITLKGTGQKMPIIGFGLLDVSASICADVVYKAIQVGYRLFDGAADYGNEKEAGEGLARAIKDGLVKREDVFVTSKLWNTNHAKEHVLEAVKKSLADWGLDYFDLYLIHFPISLEYILPDTKYPPEWLGLDDKIHLATIPLHETYQAMEGLVDAGLAKNIGVSNYNGALLLDVMRYARIPPAVLQIEHHPYLTQEPLIKLAKGLDMAVTAYYSFGSTSVVELGRHFGVNFLFLHPTIVEVASKHHQNKAQVLLRWATQRGIAVIPNDTSSTSLKENLQSSDFDLTGEEIYSISVLNQGVHFNDPVDIDPMLAIFV